MKYFIWISVIILGSIVQTHAIPTYNPGRLTSPLKINTITETLDGNKLIRWKWNGEISFLSDVFGGWILKDTSQKGTVFVHRYNSDSLINLRTLPVPSTYENPEEQIKTTWKSYTSSLPPLTKEWEVTEVEEVKSNRPMLGYIPFGFLIKYKEFDEEGNAKLMEELIYTSPSDNRNQILVISLKGTATTVDYHRSSFERWISSFIE